MKIGDLVKIESKGRTHTGVVLDLHDEKDPAGEARVFWDDGTVMWEKISAKHAELEVINESG